ncbi:MAG TPA: hypothetical protein VGL22_13570, partial [Terracidiphilus sp.]
MVAHTIDVNGLQLSGAIQDRPVVLQMHAEDFPKAFLRDLGAVPQPAPTAQVTATPTLLSSAQTVASSDATPGTLYQPVARVFHVAVVQLTCESVASPRVDPTRVLSAGLVVRRVPRTGGVSELGKPPEAAWPWMKNPKGQFGWMRNPPQWTPDDDPDPKQRPRLQSGQPALDQLLAAQTSLTALTENTTPAFVAPPDVCAAAQRTIVYALIPTASSDAGTLQAPSPAPVDTDSLKKLLPTFLTAGSHVFSQANQLVDYKLMSDEYAIARAKTDFLSFSATLRALSAFGALDGSAAAQPLIDRLNKLNVSIQDGTSQISTPMGSFYQDAATKLIDYNPNASGSSQVPELRMPGSWDLLTSTDEADILGLLATLLQGRAQTAAPPEGRYQDASRYYRVRMYFRIKAET